MRECKVLNKPSVTKSIFTNIILLFLLMLTSCAEKFGLKLESLSYEKAPYSMTTYIEDRNNLNVAVFRIGVSSSKDLVDKYQEWGLNSLYARIYDCKKGQNNSSSDKSNLPRGTIVSPLWQRGQTSTGSYNFEIFVPVDQNEINFSTLMPREICIVVDARSFANLARFYSQELRVKLPPPDYAVE